MESLFYYGSDEENDEAQEKEEENKDELDCNYDLVTMDMSDEEEEDEPAHPADIGGESSGFSSSESCSSGENHNVPADKNTVKQNQSETVEQTKGDVPDNCRFVQDSCTPSTVRDRRKRYEREWQKLKETSNPCYLNQESDRSRKKKDRHRSRSRERSHHRDRSRSHSPSGRHYISKHRSSRSHHSTSRYGILRERDCKGRHRSRSREKSRHDKRLVKSSVPKSAEGALQPTPQLALPKSMEDQISRVKTATGISLPSYYNPVAVNPSKYAEQMQKRKLLWGGGQKQGGNCVGSESGAGTTAGAAAGAGIGAGAGASLWQGARFSQDVDGKLTAKFKRLMGIKQNAAAGDGSGSGNELIKKQEEMFNSMEMQYEVARVSTHTHRGLGLGFGVHQYPR